MILKIVLSYVYSNGESINKQKVYYVTFSNAGSYFNSRKVGTSAFTDSLYSGYIMVENMKNEFYITLSDTVYSISDVEGSLIKKSMAEKGNIKMPDADKYVICTRQ